MDVGVKIAVRPQFFLVRWGSCSAEEPAPVSGCGRALAIQLVAEGRSRWPAQICRAADGGLSVQFSQISRPHFSRRLRWEQSLQRR